MSIYEQIQISKYNKLLKQIEELNKINVKGYNTFAEYCVADEKMIGYFKELKKIEKKIKSLTVDSYETFEQNVFEQLNKIYNNTLNDIFERKDLKISNEEFEKQKLNRLKELKEDILNGYEHKCDKMVDAFIKDIDEKIQNYDRYEYLLLYKYSDDLDREKEDPRLKDVMKYIMRVKEPSKSSIMEIYDLKYTRLLNILFELKNRGIIEDIHEPIRIKKYVEFVVVTDNIVKMNNKEYEEKQEKIRREKMTNEDIMKIYNIDVDYSNNTDFNKLNNSLIINNDSDTIMVKTLEFLLKHNSPENLGLVLVNTNNVSFNFYDGVPNLLLPTASDINNIISSLKYCEQIIEDRYNVLLSKKIKDIKDIQGDAFPNIVIIVDEIYNLQKNKEINDILLKILLKGKRVGITCLLYSKLSKKNLNLGYIEDLVTQYSDYDIERILNEEVNNFEINEIDSTMDGYDFEKYSAVLLEKNGFKNVQVTQCSGDFGVDIIAFKDDIKYAIQCKKYSSPVGVKAVQEVIASKAMNDCHVAVVLTNNSFTNSAKQLAKKNNVLLWDNTKLNELIDNAKIKE